VAWIARNATRLGFAGCQAAAPKIACGDDRLSSAANLRVEVGEELIDCLADDLGRRCGLRAVIDCEVEPQSLDGDELVFNLAAAFTGLCGDA
jgi:hypothetical protein